ncbi:MAG: hypothetical protein IKU35_00625 [Bacteroidaceae bacterium]|nr:hypothetical protein [Bacteroidaceae bacterium]MBR5275623.1 hypothetical protein [Bacteroidaceae bacterium]MBR5891683.1 hypothetical protein [Bacteroidaceae bacterium]
MTSSFIIIPLPISLSEFLLIALVVLLIFALRRAPGIMNRIEKEINRSHEDTNDKRNDTI